MKKKLIWGSLLCGTILLTSLLLKKKIQSDIYKKHYSEQSSHWSNSTHKLKVKQLKNIKKEKFK